MDTNYIIKNNTILAKTVHFHLKIFVMTVHSHPCRLQVAAIYLTVNSHLFKSSRPFTLSHWPWLGGIPCFRNFVASGRGWCCIDRVLFRVTKSLVKKWEVLARRKYTDYLAFSISVLLRLPIFFTSDLVTLINILSILHSPRPLASGPKQNDENMEWFHWNLPKPWLMAVNFGLEPCRFSKRFYVHYRILSIIEYCIFESEALIQKTELES